MHESRTRLCCCCCLALARGVRRVVINHMKKDILLNFLTVTHRLVALDFNQCKDLTTPFACLLFVFSRKMLQRYGSLTAACKEMLRLLVKRYRQYRSNPISLKVKPCNFLLFVIVDRTNHHVLGFLSSFQQQLQKV